MSSKQIKGLTVEIGGDTSKLGKALESIEKKSKSLSGELGSINKLLKLDPTNTELLAQKQKVLAEAISNTEEKLGILREAEKQAQKQFENGDISAEQYRALQREVLAAEGQLKRYKAAAEDTARAVEDLGNNSDQASDKLDDMGAEAQKAANASDNLDSSAADAAKNGIAALIAAAGAAIAAIAALAESTREHRTEMGKLDTAYKTSGHSSQTATAAYKELQSVIGETDQAVEAAQQIALLASNTQQVAEWSELAAGVVGRLGDALQPETFYEAANETLKLNEATGAFTQMLEQTGQNVEVFNAGLQACATTEEKQAYMLNVAQKALGAAAKQYKATNAEVIRANKANEEWNATLAECGETVEPMVTDVKELGTALLKQAKAPLKDVATYIRGTFLPALTKVGSWAKQNIPAISATVAGLTAALVANKIATLASTAASNGITVATLAQAAAQKALNAVMNMTPWGVALTAASALAGALIAYGMAAERTAPKVEFLTEKEQALIDASREAADAFRDQQESTQKSMDGILSEMEPVQEMADELRNLADASGRVQEKDQARAELILGLLNDALGTEYEMVDGVIQKYDDLQASIDEVIQKKIAQSLIEANNANYITALQEESKAYEAIRLAQADYDNQLTITQAAQKKAAETQAWYKDCCEKYGEAAMNSSKKAVTQLKNEADAAAVSLEQKKAALDDAVKAYSQYRMTIETHNAAIAASAEEDYETVQNLLIQKSIDYSEFSDVVGNEVKRVLATLKKEAVDAGIEAKAFRRNFENGVSGYTKEMVVEAETNYKTAMDAFANAYADAFRFGGDVTLGIEDGMNNRRGSLFAAGQAMIRGLLAVFDATADRHSPARKTIEFGEDVGEGTKIGIDNKTKDVARAGQRQAEALLDAYRSQDLAGQRTLQNVAVRQATQQVGSYMAAGSQNAGILNRILAAIEKGQVLMIDRDLLIGGTAGDYDTKFGQLRMLADRGAL